MVSLSRSRRLLSWLHRDDGGYCMHAQIRVRIEICELVGLWGRTPGSSHMPHLASFSAASSQPGKLKDVATIWGSISWLRMPRPMWMTNAYACKWNYWGRAAPWGGDDDASFIEKLSFYIWWWRFR